MGNFDWSGNTDSRLMVGGDCDDDAIITMKCPCCKGKTMSIGNPHYVGTDCYEYVMCVPCEKTYEIVSDCLFGGEPEVREVLL